MVGSIGSCLGTTPQLRLVLTATHEGKEAESMCIVIGSQVWRRRVCSPLTIRYKDSLLPLASESVEALAVGAAALLLRVGVWL